MSTRVGKIQTINNKKDTQRPYPSPACLWSKMTSSSRQWNNAGFAVRYSRYSIPPPPPPPPPPPLPQDASTDPASTYGEATLTRDLSRRRTLISDHLEERRQHFINSEAEAAFALAGKQDKLQPGDEGFQFDRDSARDWLLYYGFPVAAGRQKIDWSALARIPDEDKPSSDTTEHTPFSLACAVGDLDMAQFLYYEAGCTNDAARSNDLGFTPFRFACMNDHRKVVSWLFKIKAVPPR